MLLLASFENLLLHLSLVKKSGVGELKTKELKAKYSRLSVIRNSKGDKNLVRITGSSNN